MQSSLGVTWVRVLSIGRGARPAALLRAAPHGVRPTLASHPRGSDLEAVTGGVVR